MWSCYNNFLLAFILRNAILVVVLLWLNEALLSHNNDNLFKFHTCTFNLMWLHLKRPKKIHLTTIFPFLCRHVLNCRRNEEEFCQLSSLDGKFEDMKQDRTDAWICIMLTSHILLMQSSKMLSEVPKLVRFYLNFIYAHPELWKALDMKLWNTSNVSCSCCWSVFNLINHPLLLTRSCKWR